jgi:hypothetical protein
MGKCPKLSVNSVPPTGSRLYRGLVIRPPFLPAETIRLPWVSSGKLVFAALIFAAMTCDHPEPLPALRCPFH